VIPSEHHVAMPANEQIVFEVIRTMALRARGRINDTRLPRPV
jgi:hypothetical protein